MSQPHYRDNTEDVADAAPEVHGVNEFDWQAIYEALGETEADRAAQMERLAEAIHRIFEWCLSVDLTAANSEAMIGRRLIAAAWVTNPKLFKKHNSLRKLSQEMGMSAYPLATLTGKFSREFGITNKQQAHAWNRK